ncbi:uncharacterized protein [Palaemon carinicauda]|uniref:uncharacterized protein n=1 Tax=Palaemon carinicauda TaxID=392227 RepID=UPI0035B6411F
MTRRSKLNWELLHHRVNKGEMYVPDYKRQALKRIRLVSHSLKIELGRWSRIHYEFRICVFTENQFASNLYRSNKYFPASISAITPAAILSSKASLPTLVATRLQRWAITLVAYHYDIEYRPTSKMRNADALPRFQVETSPEEYEDSILLLTVHDVPITAKDVTKCTKKDPVLAKVESIITVRDLCGNEESCKPYNVIRVELSVTEGCIMNGLKVVIPS